MYSIVTVYGIHLEFLCCQLFVFCCLTIPLSSCTLVVQSASVVQEGQQVTEEPLVLALSPPIATPLNVVLQFHGHYGEPPLSISCPPSGGSKVYSMTYDPLSRKWDVEEE